MEDINRIKLVLVEKKELVNGCLNNWGLLPQQYLNGVQTHHSQMLQVC